MRGTGSQPPPSPSASRSEKPHAVRALGCVVNEDGSLDLTITNHEYRRYRLSPQQATMIVRAVMSSVFA